MRGLGPLEAAQGSPVEALPACVRKGGAARVDVVEAAVGGAGDEDGAVELRDQGEEVEGGDGVDGVVWGGHFGGRWGWVVFLGLQYNDGRRR